MEWIGRGDKKSVDDINLPNLSARVSWHGDASIQNLVLDVLFAVAGPAATGRERKSQSDRVPTDQPTATASAAALSHEWKMLSLTTVDWK